jgi:hypothetical protein
MISENPVIRKHFAQFRCGGTEYGKLWEVPRWPVFRILWVGRYHLELSAARRGQRIAIKSELIERVPSHIAYPSRILPRLIPHVLAWPGLREHVRDHQS